jgi:hypothetical protein
MKPTTHCETRPHRPRPGGWLLVALLCLAAWALWTAYAIREPLKLMLEWELLAVFVRPDTHGWYRTVIAMVGLDVIVSVFIVVGAGWLALLVMRRAARFRTQVQAWLCLILAMRASAYLLGSYMTSVIGIAIEVPLDGLIQATIAAALGIPYFRCSRRVRQIFINA